MNAQVTLITFNVNTTATLVLHVLLLFGFIFLTSFFCCYIFQFTSCLKSMTFERRKWEGNIKCCELQEPKGSTAGNIAYSYDFAN